MADVMTVLGIDATLKNGEITARQLDAIGQKGDAATKQLASGFSNADVQLLKALEDIQQLQKQLDSAGASMSRLSAPTVNFRRQVDDAGASVTKMAAPAVTGFRQLSEAQDDAGKAAGAHGLSLGRLNMELGTAIGRFTGVNTAATRFAAMLGGSLAGYSQVIGFLVAIVAVAEAYKAWGIEADEAKTKQDELTKSLLSWYDAQRDGGTFQLRKEIEATTQSVLDLQAQLDKLNRGQVGGLGVVSQAPGGVISSILRIASAGSVGQMLSQFATEVGKGTAKISDSIETGNQAIDAATNKLDETLNQKGIALAKQTALNDAFEGGAYALELINLAYEHNAALVKNAIDYTDDQLVRANKLTDALYAQQQRAAALAEQQRAMNETWQNADKFMAQLSERLKNSQPEWAESARQYEIVTQHLAAAAALAIKGSAALGVQNKASLGAVGLGARNTASASTGLDTSAENAQRAILKDAQDTARAIEDSVNAAVDLAQAFGHVDDMLANVLRSIGQMAANIQPLIEQIKAFKVPDGQGGNLGSALGVIGAASPIVGGVVALTHALFGGAEAARQRRAAEEDLTRQYNASIDTIRNQVGDLSDLDYAISQAKTQADQQRKTALDLYGNDSALNKYFGTTLTRLPDALKQIQDLEDRRIKQLKEEAAAQQEAAAAAARLKNYQSQQNSQLRIYNATGQSDAAFALQQSLEIQQALADGLDAISIALLKDAQNAERAQREREKQTQILQDQLSTAQQAYDTAKQTFDALSQFSNSLKIGQYSPLSPRQQLDAARGQLGSLYQAALGGDANSAQQFGGVAQQFLDASRKYNASGAGYVLDYNSVTVMTDALKNVYGLQMTDAQKQVSLLQQQLDVLKSIDQGTQVLVSRPALTPRVPTPTPVGGTPGRLQPVPGITADDVASINARLDALVAVSQAGFTGTIAATQENTSAVEDSATMTRRGLDGIKAAM